MSGSLTSSFFLKSLYEWYLFKHTNTQTLGCDTFLGKQGEYSQDLLQKKSKRLEGLWWSEARAGGPGAEGNAGTHGVWVASLGLEPWSSSS